MVHLPSKFADWSDRSRGGDECKKTCTGLEPRSFYWKSDSTGKLLYQTKSFPTLLKCAITKNVYNTVWVYRRRPPVQCRREKGEGFYIFALIWREVRWEVRAHGHNLHTNHPLAFLAKVYNSSQTRHHCAIREMCINTMCGYMSAI